MLFSDTGLFGKAQEAKNTWENAENSDREAIGELSNQMNEILNGIGTGSGEGTNPDDEPVALPADGSYSELKGVNTPDLAEELQLEENKKLVPIVWDETVNSGTGGWKKTESNSAWYDYTTTEKKWANAVIGGTFNQEGILDESATGYSMFVWIPRFAYQISSGYHQSGADINPDDGASGANSAGTINVKFMKETGLESADEEKTQETDWDNASGEGNWNIHPAFEYNGTKAGIWVAKFEASSVEGNADSDDTTTGDNRTNKTLQAKPGVASWRHIQISNIFDVCKNYRTDLNSHLMKNSEWGAVAYLSKSSYGINGEITINNSSSYITGSAGGSVSAAENEGTTNDYTSSQGVKASTTETVYGIYDMSGGSYEYVAAYVNNGNSNLTTYGSSLVNETRSYMKDVYDMGSGDTSEANYAANSDVYGDAVYETSSSVINPYSNSWYGDSSLFPYSTVSFFIRGGLFNSGLTAGMFYVSYTDGSTANYVGFRPVLSPAV